MSAIAAVLSKSSVPVTKDVMESMLSACPERAIDGQSTWTNGYIGLGHQHFWIAPEEQGEQQPLLHAESGCAITADVRLDNREELARLLALDRVVAQDMSDAEYLIQAYLLWGTECVDHLLGDFAFAIWDGRINSLFCSRDPLGARSIAYYEDSRVIVVATDIEAILIHPAVTPRINETKIADFLAGIYYYPDESYYEGIRYCPSGHCLVFSSIGCQTWRYWQLSTEQPIRYRSDQEYLEHFEALLVEAVRCRLRSVSPVGISMSGGLDSPALAAIAAELLPLSSIEPDRLFSFSYIFDELAECDEREFIQPIVDMLGLDRNYVPSDDKWTLKDLANWPVDRATIFSDPYMWLPVGVMAAAQTKGCRLLLAGYWGDSLFTGARFWAVDLLRQRPMELVRILGDYHTEIRWRNHILDAGLRHALPIHLRDAYRRVKPYVANHWSDVVDHDLAFRTGLAKRVHDPERANRSNVGTRSWSRSRGLSLNLSSQGAVEAGKLYNKYRLELACPYQDRRLVEFIANVPAYLLGQPASDRRLLRYLAAKRLPETVVKREAKTSFVPLMDKGIREEGPFIRQMMRNSVAVQQGYVNAKWVTAQFSEGTDWQCSAHRTETWRCICLELWLRRATSVHSSRSSDLVYDTVLGYD